MPVKLQALNGFTYFLISIFFSFLMFLILLMRISNDVFLIIIISLSKHGEWICTVWNKSSSDPWMQSPLGFLIFKINCKYRNFKICHWMKIGYVISPFLFCYCFHCCYLMKWEACYFACWVQLDALATPYEIE